MSVCVGEVSVSVSVAVAVSVSMAMSMSVYVYVSAGKIKHSCVRVRRTRLKNSRRRKTQQP